MTPLEQERLLSSFILNKLTEQERHTIIRQLTLDEASRELLQMIAEALEAADNLEPQPDQGHKPA